MRVYMLIIVAALSLLAYGGNHKEPSNKHFWHTLETTASPDIIWKFWTDVENWHHWDSGLRSAKLKDGEIFSIEAEGVIISLEGRESKFRITELQPDTSYTFKTNLPLGALYVKRTLEKTETGTRFTHEVWFGGLTGWLFAKKFGATFREMLPEVMQNLKQAAEEG